MVFSNGFRKSSISHNLDSIQANKAKEVFFVPKGDKFRRRPITTLPMVIDKDHICISAGEIKFKTKNDLNHLRSLGEDRTQRGRLSANILEAAEASKLEH